MNQELKDFFKKQDEIHVEITPKDPSLKPLESFKELTGLHPQLVRPTRWIVFFKFSAIVTMLSLKMLKSAHNERSVVSLRNQQKVALRMPFVLKLCAGVTRSYAVRWCHIELASAVARMKMARDDLWTKLCDLERQESAGRTTPSPNIALCHSRRPRRAQTKITSTSCTRPSQIKIKSISPHSKITE